MQTCLAISLRCTRSAIAFSRDLPEMPGIILILDDSEVCAETLQIALEMLPGLESRILRSPAAVMAVLQEDGANVAAVVTDLRMARHDGLDLIGRIRADPRYAGLPVILISGDSDPGLPARALAQGADAFFSKPYSPAEVRRKLEQLLC
jgi:two-component system chemotaxis response regulator CheY